VVEGHFLVGFSMQFLGEFQLARDHCEDGIRLYNSPEHRNLAFSFGVDPGVNCLSCIPLCTWALRYPDQALRSSCDALSLAEELGHPFSFGWALVATTWFRQYRREANAVREQAERTIALAAEQNFPLWSAWARILHAWSLTAEEQTDGIRQIIAGMESMRSVHAGLAGTHFSALLAEAYAMEGNVEEGINALHEALAQADQTGERFYAAELHRLRGELLLKQDDSKTSDALASFERAIEIARNQNARSWELRATASLARLLVSKGRRDEARSKLADIYNWFTEGFDTADLKEAKALLEELSG
jgi:predicted ATPase